MSGLAIILVPSGILAALICFRWARTLALWAFAALAVWFVICMSNGRADTLWRERETQREQMTKAVSNYCSTASHLSCSAYQSDAVTCLAVMSNAGPYLNNVRMWKSKGLTAHQAAGFSGLGYPALAEEASRVPGGISAGEFGWQKMNQCLKDAAGR